MLFGIPVMKVKQHLYYDLIYFIKEKIMVLKKKIAVLGLAAVMTVAFMPAMAFADAAANGSTAATSNTQTTTGTAIPDNGQLTSTTYTLTNNLTKSLTVKQGVTATLDLNGKTLTNTAEQDTITVANGGTLTITDSSSTKGTIDNVSNGKAAIFNSGSAIIKGGVKITRSKEAGTFSPDSSNGNSYYNIVNHGAMTIEDASVSQTGGYSSLIENGYYNYSSEHASGTNEANPTLTINGGSFSGGKNTVKNDDGGKLTINGGSFENNTQSVIFNWNTVTINGGSFHNGENATKGIIFTDGDGQNSPTDNGTLTITGGTYSGSYLFNDNEKKGIISVTGGDYTGVTKGITTATAYGNTKFISGGTYSTLPTANLKDNVAQATVTNGNSTTYAVGEKDIQKAAEDSSNTVTITKGNVSLTGANAKIVNDASNQTGTVTVDGTTVKVGDSVQPNAAQTIANLKNEIASLKSQLAQAQAAASAAQSTANDSARQITQLKKDLADAQAQLKTAQEQAASQGSTLTAPAKVMNLKVKAGKRSAKLTWTALKDNATGYRIYRKTKGGKYAKVKTITKASTSSWTNKGLKKGKTYYYKVRAYKSITSGELWGAYSNTAKAVAK